MTTTISDTQDDLGMRAYAAILSWMPGDDQKAVAITQHLQDAGVLNPSLKDLEREVTEWCVRKGWKGEGAPNPTLVESMMLIVTETAEAVEAYRDWGMEDMTGKVSLDKAIEDPTTGETVYKPEGVGSEFADVFIRLLDDCDRYGVDLIQEYVRKMQYNELRSHQHGGKRL